jgi:general secretion pathway protein K
MPGHRKVNRLRRSATGHRTQQRGAALVVALLVVAMVVMLATTLSSDFLLMFRRIENQLYSEQAYAYLLGGESLARAALLQDLQKDGSKRNDNLAEPWAQEQQFPTDYGWIAGRIEDAQSRFNVNTLSGSGTGTGAQQPNDYTAPQQHFIRLLLSLKLETPLALDQAQALTEAIVDWIDLDDEVSNLGGAESQYYASAEPPGRPANRALVSPSELMLVKGMNAEIYRALAPLITVWPMPKSATSVTPTLNFNTASPGVLRCLGVAKDLQPLSDSELDILLQYRDDHKFIEAITEIINLIPNKKIDDTLLNTSSDYFLLNSETEFQGHRYGLHSLLHREVDKKLVRVEERTFGEW